MKKGLPEEQLIKQLKEAITGEEVAGKFYKYLSKYILKRDMRNEFEKMAYEEAVWHKNLLNGRLIEIIGHTYEPNISKLDIEVEVNKFSLVDAFIMAKDAESMAVEFYKLAKNQDKSQHRKMYDNLIQDEKRHWKYLDKERKSIQEKIEYSDINALKLFSFIKDFVGK
ncbi:MAG: ferritin-like domain-containing protein [Candidatus Omnitrophota bacterium]